MDKIKNKLTPKTIAIIAISTVVVIAAVVGVMLLNGGSDSDGDVKSIFIKNDKDMYAIYTVDGDKVTDYEFDDCDDFINGTAIVTNKKGDKGIVSADGEMIVDFGEYDYIFRYGPFYSVSSYSGNNAVRLILNSKGEKIQDNHDVAIISGVIIGDDKEYRVLDIDGKEITSFKNAGKDIDEPRVEASDGYVVISYNGKVHLIDYDNSKEIVSFKDDRQYIVHRINPNNRNQLILINARAFYEEPSESNFIIVNDGDITFESKGKYENINIDYNNNILALSSKEPLREFIDVNGKVLFKHNSNVDVIYSTPTECVLEERVGYENYVRFYNNGKLVKSITNATVNKMGFSYIDLYPVYSYETRRYQFYNSKGELVIKDLYTRASGFGKNELAMVTDDNDKTFLIDKEGKIIGKKYNSLFTPADSNRYEIYDDVYYKALLNDTYYILDSKGKVVVKDKYDDVVLRTIKGKAYCIFKKDNKYGVYDLEEKKVIVTGKSTFDLEDDYIQTYTNDGYDYYTYSGKKIGE